MGIVLPEPLSVSTDTTITPDPAAPQVETRDPDPVRAGILRDLQAETKRRQDAEARLAAREAAEAEAQREAAEKRGEFERLYKSTDEQLKAATAELEAFRKQAQAHTEREATARKARWDALPEQFKGLRVDGLPAEAEETLLKQAEALAKTAAVAPADELARTGHGGGGGAVLSEAEKQFARSRGYDPDTMDPLVIKKLFAKFGPKG